MNLKEEIKLKSGIYEEIAAQAQHAATNWGPGYKVYVDTQKNDHRIFIQSVDKQGSPNGERFVKEEARDALAFIATNDGDKDNKKASMIVSGGRALALDITAPDSVAKFVAELNKTEAILVPSGPRAPKAKAKLTND